MDSLEHTDLIGTVDDRLTHLRALSAAGMDMTPYWLHRQLLLTLKEWARDESKLDEEIESRTDF